MRNTLLLRIGEINATINSNYRMALVVCAKMVIRYDRVDPPGIYVKISEKLNNVW